jgi:putative ABC transport system ATP-binding protein
LALFAADAPTRRVLRLAIRGRGRLLGAGALLLTLHQAAEALVPVMVGAAIDEAIEGQDRGALIRWLVLIACLFAVLSWAFRWGYRLTQRAALGAEHDLRLALTRRTLDPAGGAERAPGTLLSLATSDAARVGSVHQVLGFGVAAVGVIAFAAVLLLRVSTTLGLLVLAGLPALLALSSLLGRPLARRSGAEQEVAAQAATAATDMVGGLRVIEGLGAGRAAAERYRGASRRSLAATLRAARFEAAYEGATVALTGGFLVVVALVGGRLAAQGRIGVGDLIAALGLTQFLIGPLGRLSRVGIGLARSRASASRLAALLEEPARLPDGGAAVPEPLAGGLALRDLVEGGLRIPALGAAPGELLGVVAPDPEQALALARCLARAVDPAEGTVELDGVPLAALAPAAAHAAILGAAHDAVLFDGTLLDNLRAVSGDPARVDAALAAAAADGVGGGASREARLAERGRSLSGGERQRVALARALAADPPVLVLHDPTTAVDPATEARIASGLRSLRAGRTTVVVTASPALLAAADRVALVAGGTVVATGSHAELARAHAAYREAVLA